MNSKKNILITGSSGMLGIDLCKELLGDYNLSGLDITISDVECKPGNFIKCDISDRDKVINAITNAKPDLIIHAAAWTDVDGCEKEPDKADRINREGTENVAISASKLDIPLIYISTDFVFDGSKNKPYNENDATTPVNVYSKTKLEGEQKVGTLKKYLIIRSCWLYGLSGKNFVDTILNKATKEKELKVVDDQVGSPTYTKDLARAIHVLLDSIGDWKSDVRDIYHVSNKGKVSWFEYAKNILEISKIKNVKITPITTKELNRPAKRPTFSVLDNGKFEKTTKFVMRSWKEALKEYISEKGQH